MAKGDIVSVTLRPETEDEGELRAWFDKQEAETISNLEGAARQIIQLVTAFYTVAFGITALGKDKFESSLDSPLVVLTSLTTIIALLIALIAALIAVLPLPYTYRGASISDQQRAYRRLRISKVGSLYIAVAFFGGGLVAFAMLILIMLLYR